MQFRIKVGGLAAYRAADRQGQDPVRLDAFRCAGAEETGALRNGAPFADLPQALQRLRHGLLRESGGDRVMTKVLALVPTAGLEAVLVAVELALESVRRPVA